MVGERKGEKHQCVVASSAPLLGVWPTTQACALTGNQTGNTLVHRLVLNPLNHTSWGLPFSFHPISFHNYSSLLNTLEPQPYLLFFRHLNNFPILECFCFLFSLAGMCFYRNSHTFSITMISLRPLLKSLFLKGLDTSPYLKWHSCSSLYPVLLFFNGIYYFWTYMLYIDLFIFAFPPWIYVSYV